MVFQHVDGKSVINGKVLVPKGDTDADLTRIGKHLKLTHEQLRQRYAPEQRQAAMDAIEPALNFDDEIAASERVRDMPDPFMNAEAIAAMDVFQRQRIVHDQGGYVDSWLGEIAVLAKDREWLKGQIADPRWADHPGRPEALKKIEGMNAQIADIAESIAYGEGYADRIWKTLTPDERKSVNHMWLVHHETPRLVTQSWKEQAKFGYRWPKGFFVDGKWFINLPDLLYIELQPLWVNGPTFLGEPVELVADDFDVTRDVRATFS